MSNMGIRSRSVRPTAQNQIPTCTTARGKLQINRVSYQADGNAVIDADLVEKPAGLEGRAPSTQHVALMIAGTENGVIHAANGNDYVLSLHRVSGAAN